MEWFCTTSFRSDIFQMGLLSALEQFYKAPYYPAFTHPHTHTHDPSSILSFYSHFAQKRKSKTAKEDVISKAELKATSTKVFDLINDTGLPLGA